MKKNNINILLFIFLFILSALYLSPILIVLLNSFKGKLYISEQPFALLNEENFYGIKNYTVGLAKTGFFNAAFWSFFITVLSVGLIVLCTSMTGWFIMRVRNRINSLLYYMFVFSMIVPFQMVMYTMTKIANMVSLDNPVGIAVI